MFGISRLVFFASDTMSVSYLSGGYYHLQCCSPLWVKRMVFDCHAGLLLAVRNGPIRSGHSRFQIRPRTSDRIIARARRRFWDGRGGEAAISTATAERARLAREQADHVALKNARTRGELIPADVEAEWSGVLRTVRGAAAASHRA